MVCVLLTVISPLPSTMYGSWYKLNIYLLNKIGLEHQKVDNKLITSYKAFINVI